MHLGATSVDILDTAASLRYRDVTRAVLLPLLADLEEALVRLARAEADTPQVGRTHGQHAVPITFGFAVAGYVSRLGKCILRIRDRAGDLRGKLSGAVGAYNAASLLVDDPEALEREFLAGLGLAPSDSATQLVEPEHLLGLLLEINTAFGVIANLADDLRHLQRSEIAEVREEFAEGQVGSSTMPQKRNPWNAEHVKSLWKAFAPRVVTFFLDQVSEHQRDLTNSASGRFVADYLAGFAGAVARTVSVVGSLAVDRAAMAANLREGGRPRVLRGGVRARRAGRRQRRPRARTQGDPPGRAGRGAAARRCSPRTPRCGRSLDEGLRSTLGCDAAHVLRRSRALHGAGRGTGPCHRRSLGRGDGRAAEGACDMNLVVIGAQWGDEGKGKIVDYLAHAAPTWSCATAAGRTPGTRSCTAAPRSSCTWCPRGSPRRAGWWCSASAW